MKTIISCRKNLKLTCESSLKLLVNFLKVTAGGCFAGVTSLTHVCHRFRTISSRIMCATPTGPTLGAITIPLHRLSEDIPNCDLAHLSILWLLVGWPFFFWVDVFFNDCCFSVFICLSPPAPMPPLASNQWMKRWKAGR